MNKVIQTLALLMAVVVLGTLNSCESARRVSYFRDMTDTLKTEGLVQERTFQEPTIQSHDVLQVSVQTIDIKTGDIFAQAGKSVVDNSGASLTPGATSVATGYEVDEDGDIELPILGRVRVKGLTLYEARDLIRTKASKFYVDPAVNLRFLNFFITILGDVNRAGKYNIPTAKVSVLDAVGLAGDLTLTARRDKILLIREEAGKKLIVRLDIGNTALLQSPYYYLHSGDLLYVEPLRSKQRAATADSSRDRYISLIATLMTVVISIFTLAKVK